MSHIQANIVMFFLGGFFYCVMEMLARGRTHISMLLAGGVCFLLVGGIRRLIGESAALISQMMISGLFITIVEFCFGMILNQKMGLNVWDYSREQYNLFGQICLLYSNLWFLISAPIILFHDLLKCLLLDVPLPHYRIF
ncbi:MAG: hypothetical protein IJ733_16625 [Lachnospiraceae bacterium]|nr:hypothetical protein [Lachnospiraceae bacterium]